MKRKLIIGIFLLIPLLCLCRPLFIDARIGDYNYISRLVLEFTDKIEYKTSTTDSTLVISFNKDSYNDVIPIELESTNILSSAKTISANKVYLTTKFRFPIEINRFSYKNEDNKYIIMYDVYDKDSETDKEKLIAKTLYIAQKFSLKKADKLITKLKEQYPEDDVVNLYLGHLYSNFRSRTNAISFYNKIPETSTQYVFAKANLNKVKNGIFPNYEIKPEYYETDIDSTLAVDMTINSKSYETQEIEVSDTSEVLIGTNVKEKKVVTQQLKLNFIQKNYTYIFIGIGFIIILLLFIIVKKSSKSKHYMSEVDRLQDELGSLENSLKKGIIHNSNTKSKIIIKLYKNGWTPETIAKELNTSLEIINQALHNQGRL